MRWVDYSIESGNDRFTVLGDWPGEVMGRNRDGSWGGKEHPLYQPGDIYRVDEQGWLIKIGEDKDDV